jgi:drug/metabolite transporter (DMT)-like permease
VKFWICALLGSATVILYALHAGGGSLLTGDWFLLAAMAVAAIGYAEGGLLSRELGGWQTMCWSLLFSAPFILVPVVIGFPAQPASIPWQAWACFGYTSVFSIFLGMIWWYRGLALGGIARVGQVQLLQPFLTLLWSSVLLGEPGSWLAVACAAVVVALVAIGRR